MNERVAGAMLLLGAAQREFERLREAHGGSSRLSPRVKHDLRNAVAMVVAFHELLQEPDEPELVDEAHQALARAWKLVEPACPKS